VKIPGIHRDGGGEDQAQRRARAFGHKHAAVDQRGDDAARLTAASADDTCRVGPHILGVIILGVRSCLLTCAKARWPDVSPIMSGSIRAIESLRSLTGAMSAFVAIMRYTSVHYVESTAHRRRCYVRFKARFDAPVVRGSSQLAP
jgi:hypothetical protein